VIKKKKTLIGIFALLLLSILSFVIYNIRDVYRLENAGIPYADERTISIQIAGEEKYYIRGKQFASATLEKHLGTYADEYGMDIPIVINFAPATMSKDLDPCLSPILNTGFYNLHFSYKDELLPFHVPFPCIRSNDFFIYVSNTRDNSEGEKYQVVMNKWDKDTEINNIKKITQDEVYSKLRKKPDAIIALVWEDKFIPVKIFLELLYICKKAGCSAPTIGYLDIEYKNHNKIASEWP
jgi:hypothetical protein